MMATTAIWDVRDNLNRVLDYTTNPEKTEKIEDDDYQFNGLSQVISYTTNDLKTEKQLYVTGINCSLSSAKRDMKITKEQFHKCDGILAYHGYQSFVPGETDAETAHQIGVELAKAMWGDRFEVLVSTHLDKEHYHNHFVVNSVSFKDGRRYYDNNENYRKMRNLSDRLCRKYRLSVIEHPDGNSVHYGEWKVLPTIRQSVRDDVDYAKSSSMTMKQFISSMENMGYTFKFNKHIAVLPPHGKKYIRLRSLSNDDSYSEDAIRKRILELSDVYLTSIQETKPIKKVHYKGSFKNTKKITGFKALYFRYMYELGILPKNAPNKKRVHFLLHEDLKYIDRITAEATLIAKHQINTSDDLDRCVELAVSKKEELIKERRCVYNKIRRCRNNERKELLKQDVSTLSDEIRSLTKEIELYEDIKVRSEKMKSNLKEISKEKQEKENQEKEHIKEKGA